MKKTTIVWWLLLIWLLVSRLWSTIYYIEDLDSLRFALSMIDYNVVKNQPHFPAYPVFCFVTKLVYQLIGRYTVAFSIIGAFSTFLTIFFLIRSANIQPTSLLGSLVIFFSTFNPLLWLMSNRYMPDVMGVACMMSCFYYLQTNNTKTNYNGLIGFFLTGILLGVRLSYTPFLFPLLVTNLFSTKGNRLKWYQLAISGVAGICTWLSPLILITGWSELIDSARIQSQGHFTDFGGTITTESNYARRTERLIEGVWADGLGFYWLGRHLTTVIPTVCLSFLFCVSFIKSKPRIPIKISNFAQTAILSCSAYLIWIFYFQNIIHKSRHVLPLLPFSALFVAIFLTRVIENTSRIWSNFLFKKILILGLASYTLVSFHLVSQHKKPTAIAQIHEHLKQVKNDYQKPIQIISVPLIKYYLSAQGFNTKYLVVKQEEEFNLTKKLDQNADWVAIGSTLPPEVIGDRKAIVKNFYHNPYVNRMWSSLTVYQYTLE
ncbi:hypothetical protein CMK13_09785 [Candidatus Poribacteria bacterium]|nr:hypothetical protein [Candidatus Poribacteria bacterium]OUT61712.1 MAG: hypothetical protein CBB75_09255 [bacterium TMED15]